MTLSTSHKKAAECLKVLANPHRLLIVELLIKGPKSVGEIAEICGLKPHVTSEHLNLMKRCGFLGSLRDGRTVYYELTELHLKDLIVCMNKRFSKKGGL